MTSTRMTCVSAHRRDRIKILWWDGQGPCLFANRLEQGRAIVPRTEGGRIIVTAARLSMKPEGIDWRAPQPTRRSEVPAGSWRLGITLVFRGKLHPLAP